MSQVADTPKPRDVVFAKDGSGPLLQRDYLGVIRGATCSPEDLITNIRAHFAEFGPEETAAFQCEGGDGSALGVGCEMKIRIGGLLPCGVRVVHVDDRSLTLQTLGGHPEAGRITFGAGTDEQGSLTFRIRSRARAGGLAHYVGFLLLGKTMQARCWIRFIGRVARACGGTLDGPVRVRTERVEECEADRGGPSLPTFSCDDGR